MNNPVFGRVIIGSKTCLPKEFVVSFSRSFYGKISIQFLLVLLSRLYFFVYVFGPGTCDMPRFPF